LIGIGGLYDEAIEIAEHVVERRLLAAPPSGDCRQQQRLAEETFRDARQKAKPRRRFEHATAERVTHNDIACTNRADEAGHTQSRIATQLHRIAEVVIETPQDRMHALQT